MLLVAKAVAAAATDSAAGLMWFISLYKQFEFVFLNEEGDGKGFKDDAAEGSSFFLEFSEIKDIEENEGIMLTV